MGAGEKDGKVRTLDSTKLFQVVILQNLVPRETKTKGMHTILLQINYVGSFSIWTADMLFC